MIPSGVDEKAIGGYESHYAKLIGIQKIKKYYADGRTLKLVTCMALREAVERHHNNAGGCMKAIVIPSCICREMVNYQGTGK